MSMFLNVVGLGTQEFVSMFGGDTSQVANGSAAASDFLVQYKLLDKKLMQLIELYYKKETLISAANKIKSYHNNGRYGFEVKFAKTKTIDDDKYHHLEACDILLEHARMSKDMFGFCLVQDASENMEQRTKEILGEPDIDDDDPDGYKYAQTQTAEVAATNGALPIVSLEARLTAMASRYIHRAADALGLDDVRESLLSNVQKFNDVHVNFDSGVAASTQPHDGPPLPKNLNIGESFEDRGLAPPEIVEESERVVANLKEETISKSKSLDRLFTRIRHLKPVNFRDGELFLRINKFANQRDIVFCRRLKTTDKKEEEILAEEKKAVLENRLPNSVVIDDTVCVYVWPGLMPSDEGILCTKMYDTIMLRCKFNDADNRLITADLSNVRPIVPLVYNDKTPQANIAELSEHDFLNLSQKPTQREMQVNRNEVIGQFLAEGLVKAINQQRETEYKDSLKNLQGVVPSGENQKTEPIALGAASNTGISVVPFTRGFAPAAAISGKTIDDPERRKQDYREHIAEMVGIPLIQLQGGMGNSRTGGAGTSSTSKSSSSSSAVTSGSANLSDGTSVATIMTDRSDLSSFLESVFEIFFRQMSNEELAKILSDTGIEKALVTRKHDILLSTLQEQYGLVAEAAERIQQRTTESIKIKNALVAQFQLIADAAKKVASLNHRFSLVFMKQTFLDDAAISTLHQTGAITALEVANIQRTKCGLAPINETEFKQNRKRQLEEQKEDVDSQQPTPEEPPGGAKKKKTSN